MARPWQATTSDGAVLHGVRGGRPGGPAVVLLHAAVADSRGWGAVLEELADDDLDLIAHDRRGFGRTRPGSDFTHLADLQAVLGSVLSHGTAAVVVGNSMGGALALDLALVAPERVASVLLIGSGVSGMTDEGEPIEWRPEGATGEILDALERAEAAGDVEAQVRLELHLWLDGPEAPEGRVGGDARRLAAEMNRAVLRTGIRRDAGDAGLDTWHGLGATARAS